MTAASPLIQRTDKPLTGQSVLVTRPLIQAQPLISQLQQLGATVVHQPCIEIKALHNASQSAIIASLSDYDWLIFISSNAVEYGFRRFAPDATQQSQLAAIGKATAALLKQRSGQVVTSPADGFNSEALLNCVEFSEPNIKAKKVLIIRGGKGREHLKQVLNQRQADVDYLDIYQRDIPPLMLHSDDVAKLDIITVSSQQGLENLCSLLDARQQQTLFDKTLITPGKRCSEKAMALGFKQIVSAENASDDAMLQSIIHQTSTRQQ